MQLECARLASTPVFTLFIQVRPSRVLSALLCSGENVRPVWVTRWVITSLPRVCSFQQIDVKGIFGSSAFAFGICLLLS